jgi:hypothetical protein
VEAKFALWRLGNRRLATVDTTMDGRLFADVSGESVIEAMIEPLLQAL